MSLFGWKCVLSSTCGFITPKIVFISVFFTKKKKKAKKKIAPTLGHIILMNRVRGNEGYPLTLYAPKEVKEGNKGRAK